MNCFVSFEGGEGVGKSTLIKEVRSMLCRFNVPVITTREPGGTDFGEEVRNSLKHDAIDGVEELMLVLAARRHHIRKIITPNISEGNWVLCDRFCDSTYVYQGLNGVQEGTIRHFEKIADTKLLPDITFLLDINPVIAKNRMSRRKNYDKFDNKPMDFHFAIRSGFLQRAKRFTDRIHVIKANVSRSVIIDQVADIFDKYLNNLENKQKGIIEV
jgi:dTMP kinase